LNGLFNYLLLKELLNMNLDPSKDRGLCILSHGS
jgi:hypothetical protein